MPTNTGEPSVEMLPYYPTLLCRYLTSRIIIVISIIVIIIILSSSSSMPYLNTLSVTQVILRKVKVKL
jgi:hypothetical protein